MKLLSQIRDTVTGAFAGASVGLAGLQRTAIMAEARSDEQETGLSATGTPEAIASRAGKVLEGAFAELELAFEDVGWNSIGNEYGGWNFKRSTLKRIVALSRVMYLVNPLIKRAVTVQELYVWGRGVKVEGEMEAVDEVLQDFLKDPKNQSIIGAAWAEREREQRIDGNTFFIFYKNPLNGTARIRLLPFDQIDTIECNPEDSKEPWYYCRTRPIGYEDGKQVTEEKCYYPDINYNPARKPRRAEDGSRIMWDTCVFHVKTGGLSSQRFGLPELFATLNWATGYKKILENFATILAAHARLAMQITGLPGKKGVAAAKNKMQTNVSRNNAVDNNPPNNTAAWFLSSGGAEIKPIKTAGTTTGPDEARALRSMVAAGSDTPEHFFGDSDIGNFATSSTLDRPTELKMISRQQMWVDVIYVMCNKLIEWSAVAPAGKLRKAGYRASSTKDAFDGTQTVTVTPPANDNINVHIEFPNILERDVTDRVRSIVQAVTLGGSSAEGIIPDRKVVCSLLLDALGERDADRLTDILYPEPVLQGFIDPADMSDDQRMEAKAKKAIGDAALKSADNIAKAAKAKPSGSPASGARV